MAIVTEISWDDMLEGKPLPETPARKASRDAVSEIAEKAKAKVASQSNGATQYFVVNGECQCKDFPTAPSGWCKHRIAAGMAKRAYPLAKTKREAVTAPQNGHA